ncbi:hypothetical protein OG394_18715 [Kribbella sp. NBC_01245]|uniref:hypothetical protein n=1 Tax=Kribbella sp. NBC_01245 TaxID=2903578 RepID=UPI002E27FA80|nr:hypothetical protein [Kribbella sp. NBC_01245]
MLRPSALLLTPALVLTSALVLTACGTGETGTGSQATDAQAKTDVAPVKAPLTGLAALVVTPSGFRSPPVRSGREISGPFNTTKYVEQHSTAPYEDRALLLNADFTEGYYATRISADRRTTATTYLFRAGTPAKARTLQHGMWAEDTHGTPFRVPGVGNVQTGTKVIVSATSGRTVAAMDVTFTIGRTVVRINVRRHLADNELGLLPNTRLATTLAQQQYRRLRLPAATK